MKKQFFNLILTIVILSLMLVINSCKKDVSVDPADNGPMVMTSRIIPDNVMQAFDAEEVTIYGDVDTDISCYPDFSTDQTMVTGVTDRMGPGFKIADVIKRMNLTDRQIGAIRTFMVDYHNCVKSVMLRTEAQRQKALRMAAAARADVIAAFKNGDIDRSAAARRIAQINKDLKASLDSLIPRDALCDCLKTLYRSIRSVLVTSEQQALWDKWVAVQKLPCLSVRATP